MYSKSSLNLLLIIASFISILGITACGIKTGEKNAPIAPAKVKSATCLTQAISDLKVFFKGDATDAQVNTSFSCLEEVFVAFKENIRGAKKNVYTPREIATFIEINFLSEDDSKFSEEFLNELMYFKVALIGGNEEVISKTEIDSIVGLVGRFKPDFVALNPHMKVLTLNWKENFLSLNESAQEQEFTAAKVQFQKLVSKLTAEFASGNRVYSTDHLAQFALEVLKFAKAESDTLETIQKALPLVSSVKKLLIGGEASLLGEEWTRLGTILHAGYAQYLRYEYFLKDLSDNQTVKRWNGYEQITLDVISLLETVLVNKKVILTTELVQFVLLAQKQEVIETNLTENALTMAIDSLWSNFLNRPEDRLQGIVRPGLDDVGLQVIVPEIKTWLGMQKHIAQVFSSATFWKKDLISAEFQSHIDFESNLELKKALSDITGILAEPIPLTMNPGGMLKILDPGVMDYHQDDLTWSNLARLLSRLLIHSYANDLERANGYISVSQEEAQAAYDQLKPLAVDLDVIDKSNDTFVKSRFLESNLFLTVSNGDKWASFSELHHLVIHIISGLFRSGEIKDEMIKIKDFEEKCILAESNGEKKIKGTTRVYESCVLDQYINSTTGFESMPGFLEMRSQYTEAQLRDHYMALLKAAGHIPREDKTVLMSDADLFPHVVQYIEMVYARHDLNHDNLLQKEEAQAAFPIFKTLLADLVKPYKQIKEEHLEGVFIYILKFGRPPNPKNLGEALKFFQFVNDKTQKDWVINSTRIDLGKIFNYIAENAIAPKPPVMPTPNPNPVPPATPAPVDPGNQQPTPQPVVPQPQPGNPVV